MHHVLAFPEERITGARPGFRRRGRPLLGLRLVHAGQPVTLSSYEQRVRDLLIALLRETDRRR